MSQIDVCVLCGGGEGILLLWKMIAYDRHMDSTWPDLLIVWDGLLTS